MFSIKKIIPSLFFICLVFLSSPHPVFSAPQTDSPALSMPEDIRLIQESGRLKVAVLDMGSPPFVFREDGVLMGADIDMALDIARRLGVKAEFIPIDGTYNDIIDAVAAGQVDIGLSELSKTLERSKRVYFTQPYIISEYYFVTNRLSLAHAKLKDPDARLKPSVLTQFFDRPNRAISTMRGSAFVGMVEEMFPAADHVTTRTWRDSTNLVFEGKADAAILPSSAFLTEVNADPGLHYKVERYRLDIYYPVAIAVRPGLPDLLRWLNDYLDVTAGSRESSMSELVKLYMQDDQEADWWMLAPDFRRDSSMPADVAGESRISDETSSGPNWPMVAGVNIAALILIWFTAIRRKRSDHWLLSPWTVLAAMATGGVTGMLAPGLAVFASPPAGVYMNFWKLCVLPIMIATIITSVFRLLSDGNNSVLVRRLIQVVPLALILITTIGVLAGLIGQPGTNFSAEAQTVLVRDMGTNISSEVNPAEQGVFDQFMNMANNIVPDNVLRPIVENKSLAVLFIALFFSIMLARNPKEGRYMVVDGLDTVLDAFTRMVRASLYLLPFALYALALDFTARMGLGLLSAVLQLAICMTAAMIPPAVFTILALRMRLNLSFKRIVSDFGPMFLVAFSARSSVIAMPIGLEALGKFRNINHDQAMAAFPLSLLICHSTYAVFFSIIPIFIGQVFGVEFTLFQMAGIVLGAVLCTVAAIGTIGMSYVLLLSIVCTPLGLPLEPAVMVGMAVVAVLDPLMSAIQALFGCGLTALMVEKKEQEPAYPDASPQEA